MPKDKLPSGVIRVGQQESSSTMAKKCVGQMAGCFTKEEIHAGVGYVQGPSCGFGEKTAEKKKTMQAVIPGGCTSLLQPLDVCLNKPFKGEIHKL